jgi:hypothetical protein
MTTSGTYTFGPNLGDLFLNAFSRIQVKRTELTPQHISDARTEANLLQADWVADGITLWTVEIISQALTQGVATYSIPARVVMVLDLYVSTPSYNRLIMPFSRTDYASLANPTMQGFPTSFWQDRTIAQTITLWPVPDGGGPYTMSYYAYTQMQDASLPQGGNVAVPYWWLDAFTAGLAYRLSRHYAPTLEATRKADAVEAYMKASKQVENVPLYITPGLQSYYRS